MANDKPFTVEEQIDTMKKYVTFTKRARMRDFFTIFWIFSCQQIWKVFVIIHQCICDEAVTGCAVCFVSV